jgi:predicted Zn finger-like uncharacterized protein
LKFLCEHCKAKYQISDDKVAGRTVRMKCRKCGGNIEVRAAVTETSVSLKASEVKGSTGRPPPPKNAPPRPSPLATSLAAPPRPAGPATRPPPSREGALANAMQRNVEQPEEHTSAGMDLRELSAADEWYVAVNGVPVGPVRVAEVRRKAAMGAVTEDSLCWQEGMEEWRAIRTVAELAAVVREAAHGGRSSQLPGQPRTGPPGPVRPAPPARATGQHAAMRDAPKAPSAPPWATKATTTGMGAAQAVPYEDDAGPTLVGRSPLLDPEAGDFSPGARNGAAGGVVADPFKAATSDPFAMSSPQVAPPATLLPAVAPLGGYRTAAPVPAVDSISPPIVVAPARRVSPIAIGMVAMFGCFGVAAAYFAFARPERPIVVNVPAPTIPSAPVGAAPPAATSTATPGASATPADSAIAVAPVAGRPGGGRTGAAPAGGKPGAGGPAAVTDPALADLIKGASGGPAAGPGGGGGGGNGPQLSEDDIRGVVQVHQTQLKRTCWERSGTQTPSVNEKVHIVVSPGGGVQSATASGNDPIVGHCLEEEIKRWHWPGGGEVEVPFHFVRQ